MKHTPGPWKFMADAGTDGECVEVPLSYNAHAYCWNPSIVGANGTEVVGCDEYDVFGPPMSVTSLAPEREANIRLILAAPELLALLMKVRPWVSMTLDRYENASPSKETEATLAHLNELWNSISAAIAKATGETP